MKQIGLSIRTEIRDLAIFFISAIVLTVYGAQVCPFLETLSALTLFIILTIPFVGAWILRCMIKSILRPNFQGIKFPQKLLVVDFLLWGLVGAVVTIWNFSNYDFPVESGLKIVFGCLSLGFFSATYIFLEGEFQVIQDSINLDKQMNEVSEEKYLSISKKFLIFFFITFSIVTGILLLLVYKDFGFVIDTLNAGKPFKFIWIAQEILFVVGLLIIGTFFIARQYGKNLKLIFSMELTTLGEIKKGNLEIQNPVVTNDELGIIAIHTNRLICELKEKRKIKETFGKYIDKNLADTILLNEGGNKLGGCQTQRCILFTDIRNFTPISENLDPQTLVSQLNKYFSIIVDITHQNSGMVDKFIGDAAMVVFGLGDNTNMCDQAVSTAIQIQKELAKFNQLSKQNGLPQFLTGIGIHTGNVISGNIGSIERLEYTVIGDTVNTAGRIQVQTRDLNRPILISKDIYSALADKSIYQIEDMGELCLKGKSEKTPLYSIGI